MIKKKKLNNIRSQGRIRPIFIVVLIFMIQVVFPQCPTSYPDASVTSYPNGGTVWGSGPYTDDSDVGLAARHKGLMKLC